MLQRSGKGRARAVCETISLVVNVVSFFILINALVGFLLKSDSWTMYWNMYTQCM